jgi:hypothetical protein
MLSPATLPYVSPFSPDGDGSLSKVFWSDVFGEDGPTFTSRTQAMKIPAVARARNLIVSTICRAPIVAYRGDAALSPRAQPTFLYRTDGVTPPSHRLAWTVDDLIFYGWSLWGRGQNSVDTGRPLTMDRIDRSRWRFDGDGHIEVDERIVRSDEVMLIPGLHEGILNYGVDTIEDTRKLYAAVRQALETPVPLLELHQTNDADLDDTKIDALIKRWATARKGGNGGVAYTNSAIEAKPHGRDDSTLLIEARNAASLDLARMVGVGASRIDATAPKSTLNYETTSGKNLEFVDFDLALYITPIQARLSMDDIVAPGIRCAIDLTDFTSQTPSPTGPATQD